MSKVELFNQVSSFFDKFELVPLDEGYKDDYMVQIKMTVELKELLTSWESEGLILTIEDISCTKFPDPINTVIGTEYKVTVSLINLRQDGLEIYSDWNQFLHIGKNKHIVPEIFYIIESKLKYPDKTKELAGDLKCYIETVSLVKILIEQADHYDIANVNNVPNIVMLHQNRLEILCNYTLNDVQSGLDGITSISKWIQDESHKDQRVSILRLLYTNFLSR